MPDGVFASIQGLDELKARLSGVTDQAQKTVWSAAARKGAQAIARQAAKNALRIDDPQTAESIARNIVDGRKYPGVRKKGKRFLPKGDVGYRVGVKGGARSYANTRANVRSGRAGQTYETLGSKDNPGGDTFYWRFVELGTQHAAAQPFLRPAGQQAKGEALTAFIEEADKALTRAVKREAKRIRTRNVPTRL